jgi:hypothetical protein
MEFFGQITYAFVDNRIYKLGLFLIPFTVHIQKLYEVGK